MQLRETTAETLLREGLVPLHDVPKLVPAGASGRAMHRAVAWRWVRAGVVGPGGLRVTLEAIRVGKRWMTSQLALARFFDALSGGRPNGPPGALQPTTSATLSRFGLAPEVSP